MLRRLLLPLLLTGLLLPTAAPAESFSGLHMSGQTGEIIGDGAQVGYVPVQISWELIDPPGVYSTCYGDWQWESAPVQIELRRGDTREGELVASLGGSGRSGSVSITLPAPDPSQDSSLTAWLSGSVTRPHSTAGDCVYDGVGEQDTRPLDENLPLSLPYPQAEQCTFTVRRVRGRAGVQLPGQEISLPVVPGSSFSVGSDLVVAPGSWVEMSNSVEGGSTVRVYSRSRLSLTAADCRTRQRFSLKLWLGRIWMQVERLGGRSNQVEVVTDNAVTGVRGTIFDLRFSGSGAGARTRLGVQRGTVQLWSPLRPGVRRNVRAGQHSQVRGAGSPSRPRR